MDDGCQGVFPRMEPIRKLCFLCTKLRDEALTGADVAEIRVGFFLSVFFAY